MKKSTSIDSIDWRGKKFRGVGDVTTVDVLQILDDWDQGVESTVDVMTFAEGISWISGGWPTHNSSDPRATLVAVLELLELLYINPVLREDIPAMRSWLRAAEADPEGTWRAMDDYWDSVDFAKRMQFTGPNYPD